MKLTPTEARKVWVDALRSGEYKQGYNRLETAQGTYCCLGVACDLYIKHEGDLTRTVDEYNVVIFGDQTAILPDRVCEWLDLKPWGDLKTPIEYMTTLTRLNDSLSCDFRQIADVIESGNVKGKNDE